MRKAYSPTIFFLALTVFSPSLAAAQPSGTVNSYTPAEERKAKDEARAAGYEPGIVTQAQAGNLFINATRGGQHYSLTVTPDGKVYASSPSA